MKSSIIGLYGILTDILSLASSFECVSFHWISLMKNAEADKLAKQVLSAELALMATTTLETDPNTGNKLVMELELGLKVTRTREDVSSSVDFRFSKDPFGPLVLSQETDSRFIIIIHLKGFKKEGIEIEINKEGDRITIRGRKPVEEMVMIRWMAWRNEVEMRAFRKKFLIPDVVDLDKIKARFDDDDATLTITMPKRVKGISGFNLEQAEEEVEEESVGFGDVSEEGFSGGVDETQIEDDDVEEIQQIVEEIEQEPDGNSGSDTKSKDSGLEKLPDIIEQEDNEEVMEHKVSEETKKRREHKVSEGTKSDGIVFGAVKEIEEQESDEVGGTSKSRVMEKKKTDDDDGLRKAQGIDESLRRNEESKIQEMVEEETVGQEKDDNLEKKMVRGDPKEDVDAEMGEGFTPNIERTPVKKNIGEGFAPNIAETEKKPEDFESEKQGAGDVDKIHKLEEKKKEEDANVRAKGEDRRSLVKLQENKEEHSKGRKRQNKQENIKGLLEEKAPEADTKIVNDIPKPVKEIEVPEVGTLGETGDEGKEKKKIVETETKPEDFESDKLEAEEVDSEMGKGFAPNIAETVKKPEDFEFEKLGADEVEKIQKLVENKEEEDDNKKEEEKSEGIISLIKTDEVEEQQSQGQKQEGEHEMIEELVEEKTPEAETNISNDTLKPVEERGEGKQKIPKLFQEEETKKQPEEHKEKRVETGGKIDDAVSREVEEIIRQQDLDRCEKESKTQEVVKSKTNDEEKGAGETEIKEQESYGPKILWDEEIAEKKTEFDDHQSSRRDSDSKEEVDVEIGKRFKQNIAETETKAEEFESHKPEPDEEEEETAEKKTEQDIDAMKRKEETQEQVLEEKVSDSGNKTVAEAMHEEDEPGNQFQELIEGEKTSCQGEVKGVESEKNTREVDKRFREAQEVERTDSDDVSGIYGKGELQEEDDRLQRGTSKIEQELVNLNSQMEQELEDENINSSCKDEESEIKTDDVIRKVQGVKEYELSEPKRNHGSKIKEMIQEKIGEVEKEDEVQESHEPNIRKERRCKTKITGTEEPSGQAREEEEKEKFVESRTITEIKDQRPDKPESHEKRYKIQEMVEAGHNEEQKDTVKAKQTSKGVQEIEQQESDGLSREKMEDDNSRKFHELEEPKTDDGWTRVEQEKMKDLVKEEATGPKDKCTAEAGHSDHKEEQHEDTAKTELKAEEDTSEKVQEIEKHKSDELQRSLGQDKMQEIEEKEKTKAMEENETVERRKITEVGDKTQELVEMDTNDYREKGKTQDGDDILRSQETEKLFIEELKKEDEERKIHQSVEDVKGEDKTLDQEDDRVGEAEAVVANNEKDSSRKLHTTTGGEELKQQEEIPDPRVKEGDGERVAEKETKMEKVHVQEPEVKTENGESRRGQKGKQEKNDETRSDDGIVRKVGETKVQESDEKKDQEPEEKIEEPERKEASNDGVKLVTEEDSLTKGQEFMEKDSSKRRPVRQENIQQDAEKQEDEGKSDAGVEMQAKIKESKGIEGSEKVAGVEMQANTGIIMKEQETKRQEPYELLENEEHDKIPEPIRNSEDVSSRKVQKIKAQETDGLEKHRELSGFQENESTKCMEDSSQTQDVEESGPDHTEQENIQEIMAEEEEEKKNEKEKRMPHVDSKANDDSSEKNETERLRGKKQKEDHQEVVETETSDQMKEEREEKIVGKAVTRDECDNSRKNHENEEEQSDKLERHRKEEMKKKTAEAEGTRKNKGIEERESAKMVERHDNQDNITDLVEEKMNNQEGEDKKSMSMKVLEKSEDHESTETEGLRKQDKDREQVQQRSTDNLKYEETIETVKDKESRKTHQLKEERLKEKENRETECEDGSSKRIQEIDKDGSTEPRRVEERDKIQPVDRETIEDSEEDWEAEVIQEMDSDEDNDKLRKIRRIKLGISETVQLPSAYNFKHI
ncbi:BnaA02g17710D [Brassica napus]|uniref:BnaA02g17710D protein n=1 Tax=Brassica napus TaxID=3708 RepID=A0A078I4Y9_BRANA|nr:BnaA02g17710D [Brassica napus]